jgi:GTP-binding protein EngB required for normal cell division
MLSRARALVRSWLQMESVFLRNRKSLRTVFLLLDSRRGITEVDDERIQAMEDAGVSYQVRALIVGE